VTKSLEADEDEALRSAHIFAPVMLNLHGPLEWCGKYFVCDSASLCVGERRVFVTGS
jgi:hypothetical protein